MIPRHLIPARRASEWSSTKDHSLTRRARFGSHRYKIRRPTNWPAVLLLLSWFVVGELHVGFCEQPNALTDKTPASTTREPISDDDAPTELKRLIADGKVKVVYDSDPEFVKAARGWADFHVRLEHTFKYGLVKSRKNDRWQVRLTVAKLEQKIELTHLIRLPASFKSPDVWQGSILRHEFDHVAVSLDPRAMLLLHHLLKHLPVIERTLEPQEEPSNERLKQIITEEIDRRHKAVIELMRQNNVLLDKVGNHGARSVPDRAAFFAKLYTKEHLAEQKFPFVDQVLKLLETKEYQNAELRFVPRDPTE